MVSGEEDRKQSEKACPPQSADRASSAERRAAKKEAIKAFLTQRISEQASLLDFNVDASATEKAEEARIQCGVYEAKFGQLTFQDGRGICHGHSSVAASADRTIMTDMAKAYGSQNPSCK
ncbi:unnamed protein product [Dibothriocephalus latus]|uniref:Uncharacterized protein n=1 Tax=Dibothriocephalus latus TaxID=60516 RepID=A0A3P7PEM9_DIBLA|nr:unnamed protein product [Dibothriocephalus latus]